MGTWTKDGCSTISHQIVEMTHRPQNYEVINLPFRNEGLPLLEFEGHTGNTLKKRLPPDWQCQL